MAVKFFSFDYANVQLRAEWLEAITRIVDAGIFIKGEEVSQFEELFSNEVGVTHAIGVSNGFDGLELGLRAIGVGPGDNVIVPAHTFIATWNAILACGANPIGVDVGPDAQIDINRLEQRVKQSDISCVIPVHMHGHMADMKNIKEICNRFEVAIIEDASQAHFASREGFNAGAESEIGVFSLYPTKNLGAIGDAGIMTTNKSYLAEKIRKLANYGSDVRAKYIHRELGFNRRLDPLQAAVLNINIRYLKLWNSIREEHAAQYSIACQRLGINHLVGHEGSVWHHFCILIEKRDQLVDFLKKNGIGTEIHYPRLAAHECESFANVISNSYPNASRISNQILSLPISQFHTPDMISEVIYHLEQAQIKGLI
jgi:dTDP-4-amino-4,6-dideoxygalactose transaminase